MAWYVWIGLKCPYRLHVSSTDSRGVGKQAGGILGGHDKWTGLLCSVYLTYYKWRHLYAVCSKLCCVVPFFCIVTILCIVTCKIKKLYWCHCQRTGKKFCINIVYFVICPFVLIARDDATYILHWVRLISFLFMIVLYCDCDHATLADVILNACYIASPNQSYLVSE
jgi:hypothetical protein